MLNFEKKIKKSTLDNFQNDILCNGYSLNILKNSYFAKEKLFQLLNKLFCAFVTQKTTPNFSKYIIYYGENKYSQSKDILNFFNTLYNSLEKYKQIYQEISLIIYFLSNTFNNYEQIKFYHKIKQVILFQLFGNNRDYLCLEEFSLSFDSWTQVISKIFPIEEIESKCQLISAQIIKETKNIILPTKDNKRIIFCNNSPDFKNFEISGKNKHVYINSFRLLEIIYCFSEKNIFNNNSPEKIDNNSLQSNKIMTPNLKERKNNHQNFDETFYKWSPPNINLISFPEMKNYDKIMQSIEKDKNNPFIIDKNRQYSNSPPPKKNYLFSQNKENITKSKSTNKIQQNQPKIDENEKLVEIMLERKQMKKDLANTILKNNYLENKDLQLSQLFNLLNEKFDATLNNINEYNKNLMEISSNTIKIKGFSKKMDSVIDEKKKIVDLFQGISKETSESKPLKQSFEQMIKSSGFKLFQEKSNKKNKQ